MPERREIGPDEIANFIIARKAAAEKTISDLMSNASMPQGLLGGEPAPTAAPGVPGTPPKETVVEQTLRGQPVSGPALAGNQPPMEEVTVNPDARPLHVEQALKFLKIRENFEPKPYIDSYDKKGKPKWAIGYGSQVDPRTGERITKKTPPISRDEAFAMKEQHVVDLDNQLSRLLKVDVSPEKRAALLSFMYNVGPETFARSALLRKVNAGADPDEVWAELKRYVYSRNKKGKHEYMRGLLNRRKAEFRLGFNSTEDE